MTSIWRVPWEIQFCLDACDDTRGSKWWLTKCNDGCWTRAENHVGLKLDEIMCVWLKGGVAGRSIALSLLGIVAESMLRFLSCSHWKLKESRSQIGTADLQRYSLPVFFNLTHFSALQHTASAPSFSKSPLRALLKARSGSEVTLECKPQASPPAISLWKKGNEILQRTER